MASENQALLDSIRIVVGEAVAPLAERVDGLAERVDGLAERVEARLTGVEARLTNLEMRVTYLDERYETLDARTSQIAYDLVELGERMERGFAAIRSDLRQSFHDIVTIKTAQKGDRRRIRALEEKVSDLQQRLEKLESRSE